MLAIPALPPPPPPPKPQAPIYVTASVQQAKLIREVQRVSDTGKSG